MNQVPDAITVVTTLAKRVAARREELKMSQAELAKASGVSAGTIGNIEADTRKNPRELLAIARALGVNPEWLKSGKGPQGAAATGDAAPMIEQIVSWARRMTPTELQRLYATAHNIMHDMTRTAAPSESHAQDRAQVP